MKSVWDVPAEDDDYLVSYVVDAAHDEAGNVLLLDFKLKQVIVFDEHGQWLRNIGREGEGPGEMSDARRLFTDGPRIGVLQLLPATIVWLEADGTPLDKVRLGGADPEAGGIVTAAHGMQVGSRTFLWMSRGVLNESGGFDTRFWITTASADGALGTVLYEPPEEEMTQDSEEIDESDVYNVWMGCWTGEAGGGVWVAPERDRYLLQHWSADGELDLEVTRDYEPVVRSERGRKKIADRLERKGWRADRIRVGKTAPVVKHLRFGDDGNLWVGLDLGGSSEGDDLARVYDVIGPDGRYIRQIRLHCDLEMDGFRMLSDSTAVVLWTDEDGEQVVSLLEAAG